MKKLKVVVFTIIILISIFISNNCYAASTVSSDINAIDDNKYPGIKESINNLKKAHPTWKFQVEYTGLDFNDVIMFECQGHGKSPRNISPANNSRYAGTWICPICGTKLYDSGWYCASEYAVKYMMDPRNSLNDSDVFQFLDLSYVDNSQIGNSTETVTSIKIEGNKILTAPNISVEDVKNKYSGAIIKTKDGQDISTGMVSTSNKVTVNGNEYIVVKKGDVNNDGEVDIVDVVTLLNYIKGNIQLSEESTLAGKAMEDEPSIVDVVYYLNYIKGNRTIEFKEVTGTTTQGIAKGVVTLASKIPYLDDDCINEIMNTGNKYKVNPLYLVARIYQEQGKGTSPCTTGKGINGNLVGYYNLFNINAYGNSVEVILTRALEYAKNHDWTTKSASIAGGVEMISSRYIARKQNTLYYQKFNVVGPNIYEHQYMQNIMAAQSEGTTLRKTYGEVDTNYENEYVFTIPVYENMPKTACERPNTTENIAVSGEEKTVQVGSSLIVRTAPTTKGTVITSLNNNAKVKVIKTTEEMIEDHYWSLVVCEETGAYGYVASEYIK